MVSVDHLRHELANEIFDDLDDFKQRDGIEPIVGQMMKSYILHTHFRRGSVRVMLERSDQLRIRVGAARAAGSHAFAQDRKMHIVPLGNQAGCGCSTA